MKNSGIGRKLDPVGRIVIPKETRNLLSIKHNDQIEISLMDDCIVLKKLVAKTTCMLTGESTTDMVLLNNGGIAVSPEGAKLLLHKLQDYVGHCN